MLVTRQIFPLTKAVECIQKQLEIDATAEGDGRTEFQ
jgi:hypothetical protein